MCCFLRKTKVCSFYSVLFFVFLPPLGPALRDQILEQLASVVRNVFSSFSLPIFVTTPPQPFICIKYTGIAVLSEKCQVIQREKPFCNRILSRVDMRYYLKPTFNILNKIIILPSTRTHVKEPPVIVNNGRKIRNFRAVVLKSV